MANVGVSSATSSRAPALRSLPSEVLPAGSDGSEPFAVNRAIPEKPKPKVESGVERWAARVEHVVGEHVAVRDDLTQDRPVFGAAFPRARETGHDWRVVSRQ